MDSRKIRVVVLGTTLVLAVLAVWITFSGIMKGGDEHLAFQKASMAFVASIQLALPSPADRLRDVIIQECPVASIKVMQMAAVDAAIGQALSIVKVTPVLTLDAVNSLLGSPIAAEVPESVFRCSRALATFYFAYPIEWAYVNEFSAGGSDLAEIEEVFQKYGD